MKFISSIAVALILFASASSHAEEPHAVISRSQLVDMFRDMEQKSHWDLSKDMLWGYFFTDVSKSKLEAVAPLLAAKGYRVVDLYLSDKESPEDEDLWWLDIEKIETHSPDSLDQCNQEFYHFADEHGLDSYDGMDVGPVAKVH